MISFFFVREPTVVMGRERMPARWSTGDLLGGPGAKDSIRI